MGVGRRKKDALEHAEDADTVPVNEPQPFHEVLHGQFRVQGFIRFLRLERQNLARAAGLHVMSPDPHRLGVQAREAWLKLSQEEQQRFQADAVSTLRAAGLMTEPGDETLFSSGPPPLGLCDAPAGCEALHKPPFLAESDPCLDALAGPDTPKDVAPATPEDLVDGKKAHPKARSAKRRQSGQDVAEASSPAQRRRQVKQPSSGPQDASNAANASNGALWAMSGVELKKKARYLGAQPGKLDIMLEKAELVELVQQLELPKTKAAAVNPAGSGRGRPRTGQKP